MKAADDEGRAPQDMRRPPFPPTRPSIEQGRREGIP
jgi:hypothetical protein